MIHRKINIYLRIKFIYTRKKKEFSSSKPTAVTVVSYAPAYTIIKVVLYTVRCPIICSFCGITSQFLTLKITETEILPKIYLHCVSASSKSDHRFGFSTLF